MFEDIPYEKPLVIGTGGGNDIVSASLVVADLKRAGKQADLAGICSPGAWHTYDGKDEAPINIVTEGAARQILSRTPKQLPFIDAHIPRVLREQGLDAQVYNLSCRFGTAKLIDGLEQLMQKQGYDGIVAVDIGGDILARGAKDPTILSPMMDFTTLYAISQLSKPAVLIEFGLQTDGELRPAGCNEILEELAKTGMLKSTKTIMMTDPAVEVFRKTYDGIRHIRHGHTAEMTLKTLEAKEDICTEYKVQLQVYERKWPHSFPIVLEAKYFGKAFVIDPKALAKTRQLAFPYDTPLEQCLKTKMIVDVSTEMRLLYVWVDGICIWLGLMPPQAKGEKRGEILSHGLDNIERYADVALLWQKDAEAVPKTFNTESLHPFVVAGKSAAQVSKVAGKVYDSCVSGRSRISAR